MSKEYVMQLEATIANYRRDNQILKERLKAIENANPSEALECWQWINATIPQWVREKDKEHPNVLEPIKQALIKAQEQEKVLEIIKKHLSFKDDSFTYPENNQEKVQLSIVVESKDTECTIHINFKKQEEFELLKRWWDNE